MIDPRRRAFLPYLRRLADALALKDWRFVIEDDEPEVRGAIASVLWAYGRKFAVVRLGAEFLDEGPEEQRHTLTHELIHCHLGVPWDLALDGLDESQAPAFRRMGEYAVDGLADAIAPLLPLPDPQ